MKKAILIILLIGLIPFSVFAEKKVIGEWNDNVGLSWQQHIKIIKDNQKFYKISSFQDGSTHKAELIEVKPRGDQQRTFKDVSSQFEEVYAIDKDGNLDMYDKNGYIKKAEKVEGMLSNSEKQSKPAKKSLSKAELHSNTKKSKYSHSNKDRNPFSPLVNSYGIILIPKKVDIANLILEGIIYSKDNPIAVIDGEILREREMIGEYTILKIEAKKIILKKDNKKYILKLAQGFNKKGKNESISRASCYDLGYRWGRCATLTLFGKKCPPKDDFVVPIRCRGTKPTKEGIAEGVESVYDEYNIPKH